MDETTKLHVVVSLADASLKSDCRGKLSRLLNLESENGVESVRISPDFLLQIVTDFWGG